MSALPLLPEPTDPQIEEADLRDWRTKHIPFAAELGFELTRWFDGHAELAYTAKPQHLNTFGVTHGGASMTLLDVAMAVAARSVKKDKGVITIEMKTSFMRAAKGPLRARGELLTHTGSMAFVQGFVYDATGELCTHATGTFKYVTSEPER